MYCPKPCTCTVISHEEVDVYNSMREKDDAQLLRFPIEKVDSRTNQVNPKARLLPFPPIFEPEE